MTKRTLRLSVASLLVAAPLTSMAQQVYFDQFKLVYPNAASLNCLVCHTTNDPNTNAATNSYGNAFLAKYSGTVSTALVAIEPLDSDGDKRTNLTEIGATTAAVKAFPGNSASKPAKVLFYDNFKNATATALPNWLNALGTWTGNGSVLTSGATTVNAASPTMPSVELGAFSAGTITSKVQLVAVAGTAPNALIAFSEGSLSQYRYVGIYPTKVVIGQIGTVGGVAAGVKKTVNRSIGTALHTVKVALTATGQVAVYLDNSTTAVATFKFPSAVAGKVALMTNKAKTNFDEFKVAKP